MPPPARTATAVDEAFPDAGLMRLQTLLSPAFPVGSFAYSHGIEKAVQAGLVHDSASLSDWVGALLDSGSGWNDAVLLAQAWRLARLDDRDGLMELAALARAISGSEERLRESVGQGAAFLAAAGAWPHGIRDSLPQDCPYCISVGALTAVFGLRLEPVLSFHLNAFATNLAQAAIRLGVVGQTEAVAVVAGIEGCLLATARRAAQSSCDDLGTATVMSEIMSMQHETQHSRLFRS